jgi:hypothetical protein
VPSKGERPPSCAFQLLSSVAAASACARSSTDDYIFCCTVLSMAGMTVASGTQGPWRLTVPPQPCSLAQPVRAPLAAVLSLPILCTRLSSGRKAASSVKTARARCLCLTLSRVLSLVSLKRPQPASSFQLPPVWASSQFLNTISAPLRPG